MAKGLESSLLGVEHRWKSSNRDFMPSSKLNPARKCSKVSIQDVILYCHNCEGLGMRPWIRFCPLCGHHWCIYCKAEIWKIRSELVSSNPEKEALIENESAPLERSAEDSPSLFAPDDTHGSQQGEIAVLDIHSPRRLLQYPVPAESALLESATMTPQSHVTDIIFSPHEDRNSETEIDSEEDSEEDITDFEVEDDPLGSLIELLTARKSSGLRLSIEMEGRFIHEVRTRLQLGFTSGDANTTTVPEQGNSGSTNSGGPVSSSGQGGSSPSDSRKRKRGKKKDEQKDESGDEGGNGAAGKGRRETEQAALGRNWACPFNKMYPERYRGSGGRIFQSCTGPGFPTLKRMREHLCSNHKAKKSGCSDGACEGITDDLEKRIRDVTRGKRGKAKKTQLSEEKRWFAVFAMIFPDTEKPPGLTPWYSDGTSSTSTEVWTEVRSQDLNDLLSQVYDRICHDNGTIRRNPEARPLMDCIDRYRRESHTETLQQNDTIASTTNTALDQTQAQGQDHVLSAVLSPDVNLPHLGPHFAIASTANPFHGPEAFDQSQPAPTPQPVLQPEENYVTPAMLLDPSPLPYSGIPQYPGHHTDPNAHLNPSPHPYPDGNTLLLPLPPLPPLETYLFSTADLDESSLDIPAFDTFDPLPQFPLQMPPTENALLVPAMSTLAFGENVLPEPEIATLPGVLDMDFDLDIGMDMGMDMDVDIDAPIFSESITEILEAENEAGVSMRGGMRRERRKEKRREM